jgi:hypothetical protein
VKTVEFRGFECVELSNGILTLLVTQSLGPRIISLQYREKGNIFAHLPDSTIECPGVGDFHFYGGHRLWYAPEEPARTYLPDDAPVTITLEGDRLTALQDIEPATGLQKKIEVHLHPDKPLVEVDHSLLNHGPKPMTCAPWAITQLKPGGVGLLPQTKDFFQGNDKLPNRQINLWPYTQIDSPHIRLGDALVEVRAEMQTGALKLGYPNRRGWLGYAVDGLLFVKRARYQPERDYYDFNSSSECYCSPEFLELETLGPVETIQPGGSIAHREAWEIYDNVTSFDDESLTALIEKGN